MIHIVNLATTHDYSLTETISAFVRLCKARSNSLFQNTFIFFQDWINQGWVMAKYQLNYKSLIEPYRLGNIPTELFLLHLTKIFSFLIGIDKEERNKLITEAWTSSISLKTTRGKLPHLVAKASADNPVYLVANSNELDIRAILTLFAREYPELRFDLDTLDISIKEDKKPIKILPHVYLCLSYRYKIFKTSGLLEEIIKLHPAKEIMLISQHTADNDKARELNQNDHVIRIKTPQEFYQIDNARNAILI